MAVYSEIFDGPARVYRRDDDGNPVESRKKYLTIHNTSNDASDTGEADYAKRRTNASSHYYTDRDSVTQSLDTLWCAGHVGSYQGNTYGISWEFTGFNGWSRAQWLANIAWELVAAQMAKDCREFGIEPRLLTVAEMRAGRAKGFITHDLARRAWGETTHTDPGPGFPMDHLISLVRKHLYGGWLMALSDEDQNDALRILRNLDAFVYYGIVHGLTSIDSRWLRYSKANGGRGVEPAQDQPVAVTQLLHELAARPPVQSAPVDVEALTAAMTAALAPMVEQAAEAAVRRVMLDGATPDSPGAGS